MKKEKPDIDSEKDQDLEQNNKDEKEELNAKIFLLEKEIEDLKKSHSDELMAFINKKSHEASEIIADKEKEIIEKFRQEYEEKLNYKYFPPLQELTGIVSQFESVIEGIKNPEVANYLAGFNMFLSQFESVLSSFGISSFSPSVGEEYNSDTMEAISVLPTDKEESNGFVAEVFRKGYRLNDRILKLSSVSVFKFEKK